MSPLAPSNELNSITIILHSVIKSIQPINMIMIYYWNKKLHASWGEFMLDLDSVWVQLKILLKDFL